MLEEVLAALDVQPGEVYLDCTLGAAGHAKAAAARIAPDGLLLGIDQDDAALAAASEALADSGLCGKPVLMKGNFSCMDDLLVEAAVPGVDAVLLDLGVSSPQFDFAERGFSYRMDAPLDMRMDPQTQTMSAADVLASYSCDELTHVLSATNSRTCFQRTARKNGLPASLDSCATSGAGTPSRPRSSSST